VLEEVKEQEVVIEGINVVANAVEKVAEAVMTEKILCFLVCYPVAEAGSLS
jgi:hypothetical protein